MDKKYCIFDYNKKCTDCGECDACDLDRTKKCNNCGKCLQLEGYDMKAIKVDEIIEDRDEAKEVEKDMKNDNLVKDNDYHLVVDQFPEADYIEEVDFTDEELELIDDIDGLRELLEDEGKMEELTYEEFPGFIRLKKNKKYKN